jgi:hypothetical protein
VRLPVSIVLLALGATACASDYRTRLVVPDDCDRQLFFEDADGDNWGDPNGAFELRCEADPALDLTARNNLDCDDNDDVITGRTRSLCPGELVVGGSDFAAAQAVGGEVVAVLPTDDFSHVEDTSVARTPMVWSDAAGSACGDTGWGGQLVSFSNLNDLTDVTQLVEDQMVDVRDDWYAAWIGFVPTTATAGEWDGVEGDGLSPELIGYCQPESEEGGRRPDPATSDDPSLRMALVKPAGEVDWCLGFPTDANPPPTGEVDGQPVWPEGTLLYTDRQAHFICSRPSPSPAAFTTERAPESDAG